MAAQISDGGYPLEISSLKSADSYAVTMPLLPKNIELGGDKAEVNTLKSLKFAHAFHVDFKPSNSGKWFSTNVGYNVWKINISSAKAKSLNLIFEDFQLTKGARLYLYNENEEHFLGAFTEKNNKSTSKFAVSPVKGDELTVQYEVPEQYGTPDDFIIARVNHDYIGVLKTLRRPLDKMAGECNIDVNCEIGDKYKELKNSICRLIVDGREICSGTLINNTAEDQKPYILSAAHCYDEWDLAETTIYTFNYESPYCSPLDGDPNHSISGAVMKARHDSLDFALAEMSLIPPPEYRPYYAGWNRSATLPDSTVSIHHPQGDIKKIAFDNDPSEFSSYGKKYTSNGFIKIKEWDAGVTEVGSSGGGLFNTSNELIGTLTGGAATCGNPVNDYFARFDMYWDYKSDTSQQVKYWLDPLKSGQNTVDGKIFYEDDDKCMAFTHLEDSDNHGTIKLTSGGGFAGYWGGTNDVGITEIVEKFSMTGEESLSGVSLGVGKAVQGAGNNGSSVTIKVYNGNNFPQSMIYSKNVNLSSFVADAMNYIAFDEDVTPSNDFFVGFELSNLQATDTFAIYQALREEEEKNCFYYRLNGTWADFKVEAQTSMVNVMEIVACNYNDFTSDTQTVEVPVNVLLYPNPTNSSLTLESDQEIAVESISVFNMIGQEVNVPLLGVQEYRVKIDLSGNRPGVYFVRFAYDDTFVTRKFSYVPQ